MVKSFLILISLQILLYSSEQIILVVGESFSSKKAMLSCFENNKEVFAPFEVNIGENGLGWGVGKTGLIQDPSEPLKYEGDKKAPVGIFELESVFGYGDDLNIKMPYMQASEELICVDDSNSSFYNQIIKMNSSSQKPKSFEYMKRDDNQYKLGVVVSHNKNQLRQRGSCIFLHVQKSEDAPTAGCTSMSLQNIKEIVKWLDKSKNPVLIQITSDKLNQIQELYPQLPLH